MLPFNQGPNFPNPQQPMLLNPILPNPNLPPLIPNPNFHGVVNPNPYFQPAGSPQLGGLLPDQLLALQFQSSLLSQIQAQSLLYARNPLLALQNPMLCFPGGSNPQVVPTSKPSGAQSGAHQPQVYCADNSNSSSFISQNHANESSKGRFPVFGKGQSPNKRFQKNQRHDMRNSKGNMRPFNRNNKRGQLNERGGKPRSTNFGEEAPTLRPRYTINYPEKEIQQWREARKRNFPTRANINKKLSGDSKSNKHDADADDKLRRQQLKEVLAKQAELGVEVADIPPSYFCGPEGGVHGKKNFQTRANTNKELANGGHKNVHKRKVSDTSDTIAAKSNNKKLKRKGWKSQNDADVIKREPSLLQKLLSADIKRENSQLLQVFRFMVLNDFFDDSTDMSVKFPVITVNDDVSGEENPSSSEVTSMTASSSQKEHDVADGLQFGLGTDDGKIVGDGEETDRRITNGDRRITNGDGKVEEGEVSEEGEIID